MSLTVPKKIATMLGTLKQADANVAAPISTSGGPKTKPTLNALEALAVPGFMAFAHGQQTPAPATGVAGVDKTETSKEDEEKKDGLLKRMSLLVRKSTEKPSPPGALEALAASISKLTIHADHGEMNKHHQRQLSSLSIKRESTENAKEEESDVEHPSSILGGLDQIQLLGAMKGAQRTTHSQTSKSSKKKRGSTNDRIASHHPSEPPPDDADVISFGLRLSILPDPLQKVVLNYGGNTHRDMLQVLSRIETHYPEAPPLLDVVLKGAEDYTQKPDRKPSKQRRNCGVKSVFCCLCNDGHNYKTIGHAAAHLTEKHWGLKPWRCMTCTTERFPHSDTRMKDHTNACPSAPAQVAATSSGATMPVRSGHASDFAHMFDILNNGYGVGVYSGTNSVPSGQTPPESAVDPNYRGNVVFNAQPSSSYQQNQVYAPQAGSTFIHTPSPNQLEFHQQPSSSPNVYPAASHSPHAYIQPTSGPSSSRQPFPLSLSPDYLTSPHTDDHSQFVASPSSYGAQSPARSSPTETRMSQRYPSTHGTQMPIFPTSTLTQRYASTTNARRGTASVAGPRQRSELTSATSYSFAPSNVVSPHTGTTRPAAQGHAWPTQSYLLTTTASYGSHAPYANGSEQYYQDLANLVHPQAAYAAPHPAIHPSHYTGQANELAHPTLPQLAANEPLIPLFGSDFWQPVDFDGHPGSSQ